MKRTKCFITTINDNQQVFDDDVAKAEALDKINPINATMTRALKKANAERVLAEYDRPPLKDHAFYAWANIDGHDVMLGRDHIVTRCKDHGEGVYDFELRRFKDGYCSMYHIEPVSEIQSGEETEPASVLDATAPESDDSSFLH